VAVIAPDTPEGVSGPVEEQGAVCQPGEGVVEGLVAQSVFQPASFGDVEVQRGEQGVERGSGLTELVVGVDRHVAAGDLQRRPVPGCGGGGGADDVADVVHGAGQAPQPPTDDALDEEIVDSADEDPGEQAGGAEERIAGPGAGRDPDQRDERRERQTGEDPEADHAGRQDSQGALACASPPRPGPSGGRGVAGGCLRCVRGPGLGLVHSGPPGGVSGPARSAGGRR